LHDTSDDTHSRSTNEKLVYMANQIGSFFRTQGDEAAVKGTAEHIKKFWDPRMLKAIYAHLDTGGAGLDPPVRQAIEQLKATR
jgi:formate dehydrogenase subunit delta